jgi:hypothetical protein
VREQRHGRAAPWLRPAGVAAVAAAASWSWFASGVRTFTRPAEVLTAVPVLVVLVLTVWPTAAPSGVRAGPRPTWRNLAPWVAVAVALVGWELSELFSKPRDAHPTLSSITNTLLGTHPSRFLGFLAWLLLGWLLVRDLFRRRDRT